MLEVAPQRGRPQVHRAATVHGEKHRAHRLAAGRDHQQRGALAERVEDAAEPALGAHRRTEIAHVLEHDTAEGSHVLGAPVHGEAGPLRLADLVPQLRVEAAPLGVGVAGEREHVRAVLGAGGEVGPPHALVAQLDVLDAPGRDVHAGHVEQRTRRRAVGGEQSARRGEPHRGSAEAPLLEQRQDAAHVGAVLRQPGPQPDSVGPLGQRQPRAQLRRMRPLGGEHEAVPRLAVGVRMGSDSKHAESYRPSG